MNEEQIKILISQAVDGEVLSDTDNAAIQSALKKSADLQAYEAELLRLKQAMDSWSGIGSSPDWEQKMDTTMARMGIKEEKSMAKFNLSRSKLSTAALVMVVAMTLFVSQTYIKRGVQGRLRSAADDIGEQYSSGYTNLGRKPTPTTSSPNNALEIIDRKIVRTVDLKLLVKSCLQTQTAIINTVRKFDGLVINSQVNQYASGSNGTIVFKVLPNNLDAAMVEVKSFGELQSETSKADDVTGQYVDTEARLGNMRTVRDRLIRLASEKSDKVTEILEVERELTRVTGDIEAMEAKLKYLSQTSAMATVTVSFSEKTIVSKSPWFSIPAIKESFHGTLRTTVEVATNTFNGVIIVLGFLLPVMFWSLLIWGGYLIWKKFSKR